MKHLKKSLASVLALMLLLSLAVPALAADAQISQQKLTVDGEEIECEKYNIDGSNYFKLRDLAYLLNGTGSQFAVGYDEETGTVAIATGEAYEPNGTELADIADNSATARPSSQTIMIDGEAVEGISVYNIGGSNFFKLRDLGEALGFDVDYDADTNTAIVTSAAQELSEAEEYFMAGHEAFQAGDFEAAVEAWTVAAEMGHPTAQHALGDRYLNGEGVEQDAEAAVEWYTKSAEQGFAPAQNSLGECYMNGRGVEQDFEAAFEWFTKAAEQGSPEGQANVAWCYDTGRGVAEQDFSIAFEWWTKSAEQGFAPAQNFLGLYYMEGYGVEKDAAAAIELWRKSADQEFPLAQFNLGLAYELGEGVEQDYDAAIDLYLKAAEQGLSDAQYRLGLCYENGVGVEVDMEQAEYWYGLAAEQGFTGYEEEAVG